MFTTVCKRPFGLLACWGLEVVKYQRWGDQYFIPETQQMATSGRGESSPRIKDGDPHRDPRGAVEASPCMEVLDNPHL